VPVVDSDAIGRSRKEWSKVSKRKEEGGRSESYLCRWKVELKIVQAPTIFDMGGGAVV
jgi:hypothetical protein